MFAISTRSSTPSAVPARSAAPGSFVCTCTLSAEVTDDQEGVAEPHEVAFQGVRVEALALHDVDRAVAIARGLQVDRVDAQGLGRGSFGKRLAPDMRGDAANDLDEPGGSRVDHARLTEDFELLLCLRDGLVSSHDEGGQESSRLSSSRASASSASARIAVSIVPSTGSRTASYAVRRPTGVPVRRSLHLLLPPHPVHPRRRGRSGTGSRPSSSRSEQRSPRDVGIAALERLDHRPGREEHVRPGVAVGNRIDVQVVDSCAVGLESGLGGTREVEH